MRTDDLSRRQTKTRAWYAGKTPPDEEVLSTAESVDPEPQVLYDQSDVVGSTGEFADIIKGLYGKMDSLKRNPDDFRSWTEEDGFFTFYEVLLDLAPPDTRGRVQVLQGLGAFRFRSGVSPDEKKSLISAVFAEPEQGEDAVMVTSSRARRLSAIWSPPQDSLLDYILARPAQAGRVISDRLNPINTTPFRLIGHPFKDVRSTDLQTIKEAKTLAFERQGEIHLVVAVGQVLKNWDEDAIGSGGVDQVTLMDALLLHEIVELVLDETIPELSALDSHIVASTFERYLKGTMLNVAVEDFFLDWPPLSDQEIEERDEAQLAQELEEVNALFVEEEAPVDDDDDLDDLPLDDAVPVRKKKKKKKKVVGQKKVKKKRQ